MPADRFIPFPKLVQDVYEIFEAIGLDSWLLQLEFWNMMWYLGNMTEDMVHKVLFDVLRDISGNVLKQYLRGTNYFCRSGLCTFNESALEQATGHFCYADRLSEIKVPALMLSGSVDLIAIPLNVRYVYDRTGAQDKSIRVFGLQYGDSSDYGHDDLTFGVHAAQDVFPAIADWVLERM